tara:strand:- start:375 stop:617 length:243 start_codon:yes stop_codon:yes gene_type:complete
MRKVQMSSFDEMMANMYQVETGVKGHGSGVAGFPRSHDGLEKAIKLAFDEGSCVTFKGEVVWEDSMSPGRRVQLFSEIFS